MTDGLDIEGVLSAHQRMLDGPGSCLCGQWPPPALDVPWTAHVAAVLREQIDGALAEAKRDALDGAARDWHDADWWGEFDDWLRDRAAHLSDTERAGDAE